MSAFKSDRDPSFDLGKYADQRVRVKFTGGREVDGVLKGFDKLDNLVLDECTEFIRGKGMTHAAHGYKHMILFTCGSTPDDVRLVLT